jgi:hypothetical protein
LIVGSLSLNLALVARALRGSSFPLVVEDFESLLPVFLVVFKLVPVPNYIGKEPGIAIVLVALVLLGPPLLELEVLAIIGHLSEVGGRPVLGLGYLVRELFFTGLLNILLFKWILWPFFHDLIR